MTPRTAVAVGLTVVVSSPVVLMAWNGQIPQETAVLRIGVVIGFSVLASWIFEAMMPTPGAPPPPSAKKTGEQQQPADNAYNADSADDFMNNMDDVSWTEDTSSSTNS